MQRPKVLVLLAAYNGARWIEEQVDSILQQIDVEVQLKVSDDRSTDFTLATLLKYKHDPRVEIVSVPSRCGSAAQNFLSLIRGTDAGFYDYVAFADQDDDWAEDKLSRACDLLVKSNANGYSSAVTAVWQNGRRTHLRQSDVVTDGDFLFEGAGQGCTYVLTSPFYSLVRQFITGHPSLTALLHYHDWAIYALSRCWKSGWFFDDQSRTIYRQHSSNDTGARTSVGGVIRRMKLIRSGWYRNQLVVVNKICLAANSTEPCALAWSQLLKLPNRMTGRYNVARFIWRNGRRRSIDTLVLAVAALLGCL